MLQQGLNHAAAPVFSGTTEGHKFVRAQHTVTILSSAVYSSPCLHKTKSIGWMDFIIVNLLRTNPITLSTWILTFANFRVRATSSAESWLLPLVNAGMCNVAQYRPTLSAMSNPRSAKTTSPCVSLSKMPHCSVMCLSLVLPPQPSDMNAITPWGVIPIKNFAVLLPLYWDHVSLRGSKEDGLSILISKQSSTTATFVPNESTNACGIVRWISFLDGQTICDLSLQNEAWSHFSKILLAVDCETPNL